MNSLQLANILQNNRYCKDSFIGVYPSNKIPYNFNHFPVSFIVNTDKEGQPGRHWQAVFIPNSRTIEFFDSFGHHPPASLNNLMRQFSVKRINRVKLQNNYDVSCGPFVIFFLISRCSGRQFEEIIKNLHQKTCWGDSFVKLFTAHHAAISWKL